MFSLRPTHVRLPHGCTARLRLATSVVALAILGNLALGRSAVCQDAPSSAANGATDNSPAEKYRAEALQRWGEEIERLQRSDASDRKAGHSDSADSVLFIGSSSIRLWDTIAQDMAPYVTIQRGYGGAKFSDLAVFARRIIEPHRYRGLVVFVANDVTGQPSDPSPEEIERLVRYIIGVSRAHQSEAAMFLVEITPTPSRFAAWPKIRQVNARLREIALTEPNTYFIPTAESYLDAQDQPIAGLFREDALHLNRNGYVLWGRLIGRVLDDVLSPRLSRRENDVNR